MYSLRICLEVRYWSLKLSFMRNKHFHSLKIGTINSGTVKDDQKIERVNMK